MIYKNVDINMNKDEIKFLKYVQNNELAIMDKVHEVFIKNKLEYGLMFGSLIGATRHQGFIPWDDDIDIAVSPEHFLKFKDLIKNSDELVLADYQTSNWNRWISRVYFKKDLIKNNYSFKTPYVDVFVFNKAPKSSFKINKNILIMNRLWDCASPLFRKLFLWIPGTKTIWNKILEKSVYRLMYKKDRKIKESKYDNFYFVTNSIDNAAAWKAAGRSGQPLYDKTSFNQGVELVKFEGRKYFIFTNSVKILEKKHINYLKLPDFEDRRSDSFVKKPRTKGLSNWIQTMDNQFKTKDVI